MRQCPTACLGQSGSQPIHGPAHCEESRLQNIHPIDFIDTGLTNGMGKAQEMLENHLSLFLTQLLAVIHRQRAGEVKISRQANRCRDHGACPWAASSFIDTANRSRGPAMLLL
jgi:hypothetical protein